MTEQFTIDDVPVKEEEARGCGYRSKEGIYLIGGGIPVGCCKLPLELRVCPVCHGGIKPARGWTWINPRELFKHVSPGKDCRSSCVLTADNLPEKAGLIWVGGKFYKTPGAFMDEANKMGISRRIAAVPRDFEVGVHWVLLAHRDCIPMFPAGCAKWDGLKCNEWIDEFALDVEDGVGVDEMRAAIAEAGVQYRPGVFTMFQPTAVEYVCRGDETPEELEAIVKRGLTPVRVQEIHPQDENTMYDDADAEP